MPARTMSAPAPKASAGINRTTSAPAASSTSSPAKSSGPAKDDGIGKVTLHPAALAALKKTETVNKAVYDELMAVFDKDKDGMFSVNDLLANVKETTYLATLQKEDVGTFLDIIKNKFQFFNTPERWALLVDDESEEDDMKRTQTSCMHNPEPSAQNPANRDKVKLAPPFMATHACGCAERTNFSRTHVRTLKMRSVLICIHLHYI